MTIGSLMESFMELQEKMSAAKRVVKKNPEKIAATKRNSVKKCVWALFSAASLICALVSVRAPYPRFSYGQKTYCFASRSSNAIFLSESELDGLSFIPGCVAQTVFVSSDSDEYALIVEELGRIVSEYGAKEVAKETLGSGRSAVECVYYYSESIPFYQVIEAGKSAESSACGVNSSLGAVKVNLHVAYSECGISVGCPFIYDSF